MDNSYKWAGGGIVSNTRDIVLFGLATNYGLGGGQAKRKVERNGMVTPAGQTAVELGLLPYRRMSSLLQFW